MPNWKKRAPRKDGLYWVEVASGRLTIARRIGGETRGFGAERIKTVLAWGPAVESPEQGWSSEEPGEDGWFAVKLKDGTTKVLLVAKGSRLHCYDFEHDGEVDTSGARWIGPLKEPSRGKESE
jgi:hypothetical protein